MASQDSVPKNVGELLVLNASVLVKNGHAFFHGKFEGKVEVFVRRVEKVRASAQKEVERDHVAHLLTDVHKNIIRYYDDQVDKEFYYIVTEWCLLSVEDLFFPIITENETDEKKKEDNIVLIENRTKIWGSLTNKEILKQATEGLVFLHSFNFVHRNLKPSNVLIAQDKRNQDKYVVKLSDFRTAKNLDDKINKDHSGPRGSDGWIAPYLQVTEGKIKSDLSEDVFILGCFYYYVLDSQHRHPFGNNVVINSRENNIQNKDYEVYGPDWNHGLPTDKKEPESQAIAIIKDMIQYDPKKRPAIKTILDRAYFLPDDYYKLYDVPNQIPGLCVIFNQEKFYIKEANRKGSGKDKEALTKIFEEFGFKVEHYDDLTAKELKDQIDQLAIRDYKNYGCLVVCILSHGDEGTICGTDYDWKENKFNEVSIEDTKKEFYRNSSLEEKPKIWIIQACQGGQLQEDLSSKQLTENQPKKKKLEDADGDITGSNSPNTVTDDAVRSASGDRHITSTPPPPDIPRPPVSDFIDIRATVPGFQSFRNPETGSLLIRKLCEQMRQAFVDDEKYYRHLEDVLKKVQKQISRDIRRIKRENAIRLCQQTIEWRSTLMDFIRFELKKTKIEPSSNLQNVP